MQNQSKYYFRFVLEVLALVFIGWWANTLASGWAGVFYSLFLVAATMLIWGVFNVPGDESRSGKAPVAVSGRTRLLIEVCIFLLATFSMFKILGSIYAGLFFASIIAHYYHTKSRITWLLNH